MSFDEDTFQGRMIIVTAPSGAGKTTIVRFLLSTIDTLDFSVSATNRERRAHEQEGIDYYFLSTEEIQEKINKDEFAEWEEVYPGQYYGTLKSEIERIWADGKHIVFDIDVKGAENLRNLYPKCSRAIFIQPPSVEELLRRLKSRGSESAQSLKKRIQRAKKELTYADRFDFIVLNDDLELAQLEASDLVNNFILKQEK